MTGRISVAYSAFWSYVHFLVGRRKFLGGGLADLAHSIPSDGLFIHGISKSIDVLVGYRRRMDFTFVSFSNGTETTTFVIGSLTWLHIVHPCWLFKPNIGSFLSGSQLRSLLLVALLARGGRITSLAGCRVWRMCIGT